MIGKFNKLMQGFIAEDITLEWLTENPQGVLRNHSSSCYYKLKLIDGRKILGAYGVSRFTNYRYHEITEDGAINYEWFCQEMCMASDPESEAEMQYYNKSGFERIERFGIQTRT